MTTRHEAIVQGLVTALSAHAATVEREPDKALVVPAGGLITVTLGDPDETGFQLGTGIREWERVIVLGHVVDADSADARNAAVDAALSQTAMILNGSALGGLVDYLLLGPPLEPENMPFKGADSLRGTLVQVTLFYETSDNPMETQT